MNGICKEIYARKTRPITKACKYYYDITAVIFESLNKHYSIEVKSEMTSVTKKNAQIRQKGAMYV